MQETTKQDPLTRYRALFDSIDDGFCIIKLYFDEHGTPFDYRFLEINPAFPRHTGLEGAVGRSVREMGLPLEPHWYELYGGVAATGEPVRFENHAESMHRSFEVYAFRVDEPEEHHVALLFKDITTRKQTETWLRRQAYLVSLADALRPLADPRVIKAEATRILGEYLRASRVTYAEIAPDGAMLLDDEGYRDGVARMPVRLNLDDYDPTLLRRLRAGKPIIVADILEEPSIGVEERAMMAAAEIRAYLALPLVKEGLPVAVLAVHQRVPRRWSADDIALAEETAERTWAALGRARAERDLSELNATLEGRVRERTAQVEQLTTALTVAEQEERQRVSQILHDDLQQRLYSALVQVQMLGKNAASGTTASAIDDIARHLTQAINVTRTLVTELDPQVLDTEGLSEALRWLADYMLQLHTFTVHVVVTVECQPRTAVVRSLLVQMARELLFNVVKHGQTDEAWLIVDQDGDRLCLHVEDRGAGFDAHRVVQGANSRGGFGLFSIGARLKGVGGDLEIQTAPGAGSRITLSVPCG